MTAAFMPSLRAWCGSLLQLVTISLLIETCLAKGINIHSKSSHGVHNADTVTIESPTATNEPSTSISIFKRGNGRVVTSIGTSYIDITIPCTASEIPPSVISLLPTEPVQSLWTSSNDLPTGGSSIATSSSTEIDAPSSVTAIEPIGTSFGEKVTKTIIISGIITETSYYTVLPTGGGTLTVTVREGTKTVTGPANSASTSSTSKKVVWVTATAKQTVTEWWDTTEPAAVSSPTTSSSKTSVPVVVVTQTASAVVTKIHDTWETVWVSDSPNPKPTPALAVPRRGIAVNDTHPANSSIQAATSQRVVRIRETIFYNERQHMASVAVYDVGIGGDERSVVTGHVYDQGGPKDLPSDLTLSDPSGASLKINFTYGFFTIYFESSKGGRAQSWRNWQGRDDGAPGWCENVDYDFQSGVLTRDVNCWYTP